MLYLFVAIIGKQALHYEEVNSRIPYISGNTTIKAYLGVQLTLFT